MLIKLVLSLLTINILMKTTSTQYYANQLYQNLPQNYYQVQQGSNAQEMDYDEPIEHEHTRRSGKRKYGSSGGRQPTWNGDYDDSHECKCTCRQCNDQISPPKACCKDFCFSCGETVGQQPGQGYVFVPYPYPLMVPNFAENSTTTSTTTTTTQTTTTTKEPAKKEEIVENRDDRPTDVKNRKKNSAEIISDFLYKKPQKLGDKEYMLTSIRKTKPTWEPKYGIVPIPDTLAEKLMSQLRQIRELQARRF